jgi:phosphoribosylglycinamide formyltransferase-1
MIVLLTYDAPHRKTQDVAWRLMIAGHKFRVVAVPWEERKPRRFLYAHRPAEMTWPCEPVGDPAHFCRAFGIEYSVSDKGWLFEELLRLDPELIVLGGAGILPECIVNGFRVLNVHPGLLPESRGLDILKWTILEGRPVGVTGHLCDEHADLGWRICDSVVPVFEHDTFHAFAMRQYEWELNLINKSIYMLGNKTKDQLTRIHAFGTESRKRMGRRKERGLLPAFEVYKQKYVK